MNKTEIQARIEKVESELASLKADLAKCDCAEGIEQEKCWRITATPTGRDRYTKQELINLWPSGYGRPAYMPECRQVTWYDANKICCEINGKQDSLETIAAKLHKLGVRMKVTP